MLPFTADVLFANLAQYNRALWPAHVLALALGLATILLTLRPVRGSDRAVGALLAAAWLWIGVGYHWLHFATIDFAAPVYALFFILQGVLLVWTGALRGRLAFRFGGGLFGWTGLTLAGAALVVWPVADWLSGQGWQILRVAGLAPAPTTIFTLGLLLLIEGRTPLHLVLIPVLWTLIAGGTAWVLSISQDLALPVAGLGVLGLILWRNRQHRRR